MQWSLEQTEGGGRTAGPGRSPCAWEERSGSSGKSVVTGVKGWTFLERALAGSKGVAGPVQVKALKAAAHLAYVQGDNDRAEVLCEECLARCRELGDTAGVALSLRLLGG